MAWHRTQLVASVVLACGFVAGSVGCQEGPVPTYPTSGTVTVKNQVSVAGGRVEFRLMDNPHLVVSRGYIGKDGAFILGTFEAQDGAPAGKHRVVVYPPSPPGDHDANPRAKSVIDPKYLSYDTSGLEYEVTDNAEKNKFPLLLDPNPNK